MFNIGDTPYEELISRLKGNAPNHDVVMRFRGDEFTQACNIVDLIVTAKSLIK